MTILIPLLMGACAPMLGLLSASSVAAEDDFGYATKAEALTKAQELGCEGAYEWKGSGFPVRRTTSATMTTAAMITITATSTEASFKISKPGGLITTDA